MRLFFSVLLTLVGIPEGNTEVVEVEGFGGIPAHVAGALPSWPSAADLVASCPAWPPVVSGDAKNKIKSTKKKGTKGGAATPGDFPLTHADELAYVAYNVSSKALLKRAVAFWAAAGLVESKRIGVGSRKLKVLMRGHGPGSHAVELRLAQDMPRPSGGSDKPAELAALAALGFIVSERRYVHDLARYFNEGRTTEKHKSGRAVRKGGAAGGEHTVLTDPDGISIEVTFDARGAEQLDIAEPPAANGAQWKGRAANAPRLRAEQQSVQAWRLGYVTLRPRNVTATTRWYANVLGMVPSDVLVLPTAPPGGGGAPVLTYMRLVRSSKEGSQPSDHHTLVIDGGLGGGREGSGGGSSFVGAAFEVDTIDAVAGAHRAMVGATIAAATATVAADALSLWAPARRTFGSEFAHTATVSDAAGARWAGLGGLGAISHFTDQDLVEDDGSAGADTWVGAACHVFNASGQVQWGGVPYAPTYWQHEGSAVLVLADPKAAPRDLALVAAMLQ